MGGAGHLTKSLKGGNEIGDTPKLTVNGSKADIRHLTHRLELLEHQFTDLIAGDFPLDPLLQRQLDVVHKSLQQSGFQTGLLTGPQQPMQQLGTVEGFPVAISFHHRDGDSLDSFIGGEAKITVEALPPATHASARVCSS